MKRFWRIEGISCESNPLKPGPRSLGMRSFFFLATLGVALVLPPARSVAADAATAPALIVKLPSVDGALADLKYLAGLAGREAEAKRIDDRVKKTFPKGFPGVDT